MTRNQCSPNSGSQRRKIKVSAHPNCPAPLSPWRQWAFAPWHSLACGCVVHTLCSAHVRASPTLCHRDTYHPDYLKILNYVCKDPFSKEDNIHTFQGLGQGHLFRGHHSTHSTFLSLSSPVPPKPEIFFWKEMHSKIKIGGRGIKFNVTSYIPQMQATVKPASGKTPHRPTSLR